MKSLKTKLILLIGLIIVIICGSLSVIFMYNSSRILTANTQESLTQLSNAAIKIVENRISSAHEALEVIAEYSVIKDLNAPLEEKNLILQQQLEGLNYEFIGLADTRGNLTSSEGKAYNIYDEAYFKSALQGQRALSDPYKLADSDSLLFSYAVPIKNNSSVVGVLVATSRVEALSDLIKEISFGENGQVYIIDKTGTIIAHTDITLVLDRYNILQKYEENPELEALANITERMIEGQRDTAEYTFRGITKFMAFSPLGNLGWAIGVNAPKDEVFEGLNNLNKVIYLSALIILLLGIAFAYLVGRYIANPIVAVAKKAVLVSDLDLTVDIEEKNMLRSDEIGEMSKAFQSIILSLREFVNKTSVSAESLASASQQLSATSEEATASIEQVANAVDQIAKGASEQAVDVENASIKANQLADSIQQVLDASAELEEISVGTEELKNNGLNTVFDLTSKTKQNNELIKAIEDVIIESNENTKKITSITSTIESIAGQTNLLSLNAAIEAARAGEAGKGFAVVAEEIRKLAEESTRSLKEITDIVRLIQDQSQVAVRTIGNVREAVTQQGGSVASTEAIFNDLANAIENTKRKVKEISGFGENMEEKKNEILNVVVNLSAIAEENAASSQEVAATVEEQTAAMEEIAASSDGLSQLALTLQEAINKFKL